MYFPNVFLGGIFMMNYEIFKEVVAEKFMDYMPSQYKDMKLDIRPVEKVNVTLDGMNLIGEGDITVTPTIYINDMYTHYQKTDDLQEALQTAASRMEHAIKELTGILLIAVFVIVFTATLAVLNISNTVRSNIQLRQSENGMLRAIGMTNKTLTAIICTEN